MKLGAIDTRAAALKDTSADIFTMYENDAELYEIAGLARTLENLSRELADALYSAEESLAPLSDQHEAKTSG